MKIVYILRGLPGSGKTHLAQSMRVGHPDVALVSADYFFIKDGWYHFDPRDLPQAHAVCLGQFLSRLSMGKSVIVDNVNSRIWGYQNYITIAQMFGYEVHILEIECPDQETLERFHSRNVHGVPLLSMERMWDQWQPDGRAEAVHPSDVCAV